MKIMLINKIVAVFIFLIVFFGAYFSFAYFYGGLDLQIDDNLNFNSEFEGYFTMVDVEPLVLEGDLSAPLSDAKALSSEEHKTEFKIRNTTEEEQNIRLYIMPLEGSTLNMKNVKYAIYESDEEKPVVGQNFDVTYHAQGEVNSIINEAGYNGGDTYNYLMDVVVPAKTTKIFNLYMWVDSKVGNNGMDKHLTSVLFYKTSTNDVEYVPNYLTTNTGNTILNLVNKQGVNVTNVDSIYFVNLSNKNPDENVNIATFDGMDGNKIKAWTESNNLYIGSQGIVHLGPSMQLAFFNARNLKIIDMGDATTANVTDMSDMFYHAGSSSYDFTLNLGDNFNTKKVTNMSSMFYYTGSSSSNFTLDLGDKFNTINVTNMQDMFYFTGRSSTSFNLNLKSHFNTSNVTSMSSMFWNMGYSSVSFSIDLGPQFNTSKVTKMQYMFTNMGQRGSNFSLNLGNQFNTANVNNMYRMFANTGYSSLDFTLNLGEKFNTSNVLNMSEMFANTGYSSSLFTLNLGNYFNTYKVTNMANMFKYTGYKSQIFTIDLGNEFNTSNVISMYSMFGNMGYSATNFSLNLKNQFNTSKVTSISYMFTNVGYNSTNFALDLGNQFNTSKVNSMAYTFANTGYKSSWTLNLFNFDFTNVTSFTGLFTSRSTANVLNVICNPLNGEFINARVGTLTGYNVTCDYTGYDMFNITLDTTDTNIFVSKNSAYAGEKITLSVQGAYMIKSFKLNGTLIEGNSFTMPASSVTITDVVLSSDIIIESDHYPYANSINNVIYFEQSFDGANSINVELTYETEGTLFDWIYLYSDPNTTFNGKYGGTTYTTVNLVIPSNYLKIVFRTDSSGNDYYGFKAVVVPNY